MTMLKKLADSQNLILLAEIGALIHDLGKLSREFVEHYSEDATSKNWQQDVHHEVLKLHSQCTVPSSLRSILDSSDQSQAIVSGIAAELLAKGWPRVLVERIAAECQKRIKASEFSNIKSQLSPKGRPFAGLSALQSDELTEAIASVIDPAMWHENRLENERMVDEEFISADVKRQLTETIIELDGESASLKDFVEMHHGEHWQPPQLVRLLKADLDGADGFDSWIDKGKLPRRGANQMFGRSFVATAFGHEAQRLPVGPDEDGIKAVRDEFTGVLAEELGKVRDDKATPAQVRAHIFKAAETAFRQALGETRRAANDVTLWDHCYSVASLYKAALAKVLLEKALDEEYEFPQPSTIGWRFLRVGVDGMSFFAQAHHVTDILGRQRALADALDRVRQVLEVNHPLGNEIYRDENGSVFVMPGLADKDDHEKLATEVKELVLQTFRQTGLGEELVPKITWNDEGSVRENMIAAFGKLIAQEPPSLSTDAQAMSEWWKESQAKHKEICTVCGVRPIGYDVPKLYGPDNKRVAYYLEAADERKVCGSCLERRGKRSQAWVNDKAKFGRTIWTDEVADNNGRFALVVGRFDLNGWLDGTLVRTMLVSPNESKNPSPARIRRCWDTTRQFWLDLVESHDDRPPGLKKTITPRPFRLRINPANAVEVNEVLGAYHVYDWPLRGGITLSVVWVTDGKGGGYFLSADNLWYLAGPEQLAFPEEAFKDDARLLYEFSRVITSRREVVLLEPSGYGQPAAEVEGRVRLPEEYAISWHPDSTYVPYIPILAEPATFMALVPADQALAVAKVIRHKYDTEMARVRDRLPLHLGLVFAPRRAPLATVLEAGRAMLEMPDRWEEWQITTTGRKATFSRDGRAFDWEYPTKMGDNEINDSWYPHLLTVDPGSESELSLESNHFRSVDDLSGTVFIRPSHFDFEFLDTTARRFEIHYDESGRRPRHTRPFLLDDLDRLEGLWDRFGQLRLAQINQIVGTIEAAREMWNAGPVWQKEGNPVFWQFVADTLAGANWPKNDNKNRDLRWHRWPKADRQELIAAATSGELTDLVELHLQILKEKRKE